MKRLLLLIVPAILLACSLASGQEKPDPAERILHELRDIRRNFEEEVLWQLIDMRLRLMGIDPSTLPPPEHGTASSPSQAAVEIKNTLDNEVVVILYFSKSVTLKPKETQTFPVPAGPFIYEVVGYVDKQVRTLEPGQKLSVNVNVKPAPTAKADPPPPEPVKHAPAAPVVYNGQPQRYYQTVYYVCPQQGYYHYQPVRCRLFPRLFGR